MERILIIDDDITFALMLKTWLSKKGFRTETAASVAAARTALAEGGFSLVLSDMRLPDEDGIALLQWMSGQHMEIPVIVMTSYAEIQNAVRCMKLGARDYVAKPVNPDELLKKIREALDVPAAGSEKPPVPAASAKKPREERPNYIEGRSDAAQRLYEYVRLVAPTNMSVLGLYGYALTTPFKLATYDMQQQRVPADGTFQGADVGGQSVLEIDLDAAKQQLQSTVFAEK